MSPRPDLTRWHPPVFELPEVLEGAHARLEPLSFDTHAEALHQANLADAAMWRFLPYGPFPSFAAYRGWAVGASVSEDPAFVAIRGAAGWTGVAAFMRIDEANGVIEIGNIAYSSALQRTVAATEALHLMIDHCFSSGFRRLEWKCNAANAPSRRAAERLGFTYEGTFRQHMIVKGANRDTAWFSMLDHEWERIYPAHRAWLAPDNFDAEGRQKQSLADLTAGVLRGD